MFEVIKQYRNGYTVDGYEEVVNTYKDKDTAFNAAFKLNYLHSLTNFNDSLFYVREV